MDAMPVGSPFGKLPRLDGTRHAPFWQRVITAAWVTIKDSSQVVDR